MPAAPPARRITAAAVRLIVNWATLNAARRTALRRTMLSSTVAAACPATAAGSPQRSSIANTNKVEVVTPASSLPAVTRGWTSHTSSSPPTARSRAFRAATRAEVP